MECSGPGFRLWHLVDVKLPRVTRRAGESIPDTIWQNKGVVSTIKTDRNSQVSALPESHPLPDGMRIVGVPAFQKSEHKTLDILKTLFDRMKKSGNVMKSATSISVFDRLNPSGHPTRVRRMSVSDVMTSEHYSANEKKLISYYFDSVTSRLFGVRKKTKTFETLFNETKVTILLYKNADPNLACHLDNVSGGNGPIVTINVAQSPVVYDCIPVYFLKKEIGKRVPVRVCVAPHAAVVMDGEMRFAWSHCLPKGYKTVGPKYTVKFIFPEFAHRTVRNEFFDTDFTVSMQATKLKKTP
jgi:alkylated DNA repair dioxygenase AlkB